MHSLNSSFLVVDQRNETHHAPDGREFVRQRLIVSALHEDLIQDDFWARYPVIPLPSSGLRVATAATTAAAASVEVLEQGVASLTASSEDAEKKRGADVSDDS